MKQLQDYFTIKQLTLILALLTSPLTVWCQFTVSGTVISKEDKSKLVGVIVVEKGTKTGTVTASDGTFSLNVTDSNSILVFSFIGFVTQEICMNLAMMKKK